MNKHIAKTLWMLLAVVSCNTHQFNDDDNLPQNSFRKSKNAEAITREAARTVHDLFGIITPGVLMIETTKLADFQSGLTIYNLDGSVFGNISMSNANDYEWVIELRNSSDSISIRAYYPEFDIIHFDSYERNKNQFEILINGAKKVIYFSESITVYNQWPDYLKKWIIGTSKDNPMRESPNETSHHYLDMDYYLIGFDVTSVKGEWVQVECDTDCAFCVDLFENYESCTGWIRWKKGNKLLIEFYYSC